MENYTKYRLKSSEELASVLEGKDNLFVIACNKCFKEFETVDEPDCDEFLKFAADQGKKVTGSAKFDFLCNKMHTERKLQDLLPEGTENVVVISCGLGIQTVADLAGKPVIAASNTLNYRGHHGMALTKKSCDACAHTIKEAEPFGPKKLLDALVIMPCTGNTLAKLAAGIADGPVTLAAKAHLRNERPVIVAVSTNDALAGNAANLGTLLNRRGYFFVPFGQDSAFKKPRSLVADFTRLPQTVESALRGEQVQPMLYGTPVG